MKNNKSLIALSITTIMLLFSALPAEANSVVRSACSDCRNAVQSWREADAWCVQIKHTADRSGADLAMLEEITKRNQYYTSRSMPVADCIYIDCQPRFCWMLVRTPVVTYEDAVIMTTTPPTTSGSNTSGAGTLE